MLINKNKKIIGWIIVAAILVMSVTTFSILLAANTDKELPKAENGVLDLSDWNFGEQRRLSLNGEWEFYWEKLISYGEFKDISLKPDCIGSVPEVWNRYEVNGNNLPGFGYATYRLKVKVADGSKPLSLRIDTMSTAYKLFVNEELLSTNGTLGTSKEESVPAYRPKVVNFKPQNNEFEIIIQVSNFTYDRGGIWYEINIGDPSQIEQLNTGIIFKDAMLVGSLLIMVLYYFSIFLMHPDDKSSLYYIIINILFILRTLLYGDIFIVRLFPSIPFRLLIVTTYFTTTWIPIALNLMIEYFFVRVRIGKFSKALIIHAIGITAVIVILPVSEFTKYAYYIEITTVLIFAVTLIRAIRSYFKRQMGASIVLLGGFVILLSGIHDVLYHNNLIYHPYGELSSVGMFVFLCLISLLLAKRFSYNYYEAKKLSVMLGESLENEKALTDKLSELDQMKDEFLANTSHELRTPLNGIINITQSLLKGSTYTLNSSQSKDLEIVVASARRLYNLINDILDVSILKHGDIKLIPKAVDVFTVANTIIMVLEHLKGEKQIILKNRIDKDFICAFCDEERLRQILYNILGNALKFTEKGYISISAQVTEDVMTVIIEDTGIGIPEEKLESIFNSFEQVDGSIIRSHEGAGLGLNITKRLVELQGGNIWVESKIGKGSKFYFTLKTTSEKNPEVLEDIKDKSTQIDMKQIEINEREQEKNYDILAVDDDAASLRALQNCLGLEGYSVKCVSDGSAALKLLEDGLKFEVVILDIMMPGVSGFDVLKKIRERYMPVELPVLLLTARSLTSDITTGYNLGANDYLQKPFETNELSARVGSLAQLKKAINKLVASELSFLQAQIKPHFIFNALSVISSLSLKKPEKAKELILDLSDYLRASFIFESKEGLTTLQREMAMVRAYISIEQARFEGRLDVEMDVDEELDCTIPMLSIQPLVENAIRHGILKKLGGGKVCVSVKNEGEFLQVMVSDNGVGMDIEKVNKILNDDKSGSVGLKNINRRLITLYGKGINLNSQPEIGTAVRIEIPYTRSTN